MENTVLFFGGIGKIREQNLARRQTQDPGNGWSLAARVSRSHARIATRSVAGRSPKAEF